MFDAINKFVSGLTQSETPEEFVHSRPQLAEATLMFHVIAVDGVITDEEKHRMNALLSKQFDLDEKAAQSLFLEAQEAESDAIDLYSFTRILKRTLDEKERIMIIENLWEMVYADGVVHELEDNVVWRVAELLAVSPKDRMALKQRVRKRRQES